MWDGRSDGGGVKLMPTDYTFASYRELERALRVMRDSGGLDRKLWRHVSMRYVWLEQRIANVSVTRSRQGPIPIAPPGSEIDVVIEMSSSKARVRLNTWDTRVDQRFVTVGLDRLAQLMYNGDHGRVVLPPYLRDRAVEAIATRARLRSPV